MVFEFPRFIPWLKKGNDKIYHIFRLLRPSRSLKWLLKISIWCKYLLNFTCLPRKVHDCYHANGSVAPQGQQGCGATSKMGKWLRVKNCLQSLLLLLFSFVLTYFRTFYLSFSTFSPFPSLSSMTIFYTLSEINFEWLFVKLFQNCFDNIFYFQRQR